MGIEIRRDRGLGSGNAGATRAWAVLATLTFTLPWPASAQDGPPLFLVNGETTVASVGIRVEGEDPFPHSRLRRQMALHGPPFLAGVRSALSWLPLISRPEPVPFDPVTLQKDVIRLRRFFRNNGFPRAGVDYDVGLDTLENRVDVTLRIASGPPRLLDSVVVASTWPDTAGMELDRLRRALNRDRGTRLGDMEIRELRDRAMSWVRHRGRPYPQASTRLAVEGDSLAPMLLIELDAGPLAKVDGIVLEDGLRLDSQTVRRQLLFRPGDTFSSRRLDESTQQLLDLDLVQVALVEVVPDQPRDTSVDVRIRITEGSPRLISGRAGYADQRGLLTEVNWSHRDFLGGARTLQVSGVAETGIWAIGELTEKRYGGAVSLEQPYLLDPRVSLISSVSGDYGEGARETARTLGGDLTAVWERGPQRFVSLRYGVSVRDVIDSRGGAGTGAFGVLDFLRRLEEVEGATRKTTLGLSAAWGWRDDLTAPTRGWNVNGGLELAGPESWSDVQYLRTDLSAAALAPLGHGGVRILARSRAGRLFPFGRSRPGTNPLRSYLRLGDAIFTEGGTGRVRGWEEGALGPKLPDLDIRQVGDSVTAAPTGRYAPLGGLARLGGSLELQIPLPFLQRRHYALVFLDGARLWTPEAGYRGEDGLPALASDTRSRFGTGAGLSFASPVGPIRIMVGYKLNPSALDLRNPAGVGEALLQGGDLRDVPENPWRRWRIHLSIGQVF